MALHSMVLPMTPSGTGFMHVTGGSLDSVATTAVDSVAQSAAARLVLARVRLKAWRQARR